MIIQEIVIFIALICLLIIYALLLIFNKASRQISLHSKIKPYNVALCISGEVRDLRSLNIFIQQLVLPFRVNGGSCDIFLHCSFRNQDIKEEYLDRLAPLYVIDRKVNNTNLVDIVFTRIYELNEIVKQQSKEYDIIIRTRPDIVLSKPITDYDLQKAVDGFLCCTMILTSLYIINSTEFISDTFLVANPTTMNILSNIYSLYKKENLSCKSPEALLYNYVKLVKLPIHYLESEITLTDYMVKWSKKNSMLKMLSKIKELPLLDLAGCRFRSGIDGV